jgi:hypothetical protein
VDSAAAAKTDNRNWKRDEHLAIVYLLFCPRFQTGFNTQDGARFEKRTSRLKFASGL